MSAKSNSRTTTNKDKDKKDHKDKNDKKEKKDRKGSKKEAQKPTMKIRLYRNGDENFLGKDVVVNRRISNMDQLLQLATDCVQMESAARSLRTTDGTVIEKFEDISEKGEYVVVSYGTFKDIEYQELQKRKEERDEQEREREQKRNERNNPPYDDRYKEEAKSKYSHVGDCIPIYVHANGNDFDPARRIVLTRPMMRHWELIYAHINNFVLPYAWATQHLHTTDGKRLEHKADIKADMHLVAVGSGPFVQLDYESAGSNKRPAFIVSPTLKRQPVADESSSRRSSVYEMD